MPLEYFNSSTRRDRDMTPQPLRLIHEIHDRVVSSQASSIVLAHLSQHIDSVWKRLSVQNAIVTMQVFHPLVSLQVGISLSRLNAETKGELADKSHHISYHISFFSCHILLLENFAQQSYEKKM